MTLDLVTNAKTQFLVTKSNASRTDPELVALDGVTNAKTQFRVTKSNASRTDPELVALDGVTNAKTQFRVTKSGPKLRYGRTDGRTDGRTHTHRFLEPLYTISPSGNKKCLCVYSLGFFPLAHALMIHSYR